MYGNVRSSQIEVYHGIPNVISPSLDGVWLWVFYIYVWHDFANQTSWPSLPSASCGLGTWGISTSRGPFGISDEVDGRGSCSSCGLMGRVWCLRNGLITWIQPWIIDEKWSYDKDLIWFVNFISWVHRSLLVDLCRFGHLFASSCDCCCSWAASLCVPSWKSRFSDTVCPDMAMDQYL